MLDSFFKSVGQALTAIATAVSGAFSDAPPSTPPQAPPIEERCLSNCEQETRHSHDADGISGRQIDTSWNSQMPTDKQPTNITNVQRDDITVLPPTAPDEGVPTPPGPTADAEIKINCDTPENYFLTNARKQFELIKSSYAGKIVNKRIEGINLSGSEKEFELLTKVVGSQPSQRFVSQALVCRDVMCAMTAAYNSEEVAIRSKIIYARYGYVISVDISRSLDGTELVWPAEKVRVVQQSLSVLPSTFYRMEKLKNIYPFSKTQQASVNRTFGNQNINAAGGYYGEWQNPHIRVGTEYPDNNFAMYFIHELAHAYAYTHFEDRIAGDSLPREFFNLSWTLTADRQKAMATSEQGFVSDYAKSDPGEDFAESVANFVRYGQRFSKINLEKYEFIKNKVFVAKDFTNFDLIQVDGLKQTLETNGSCAAFVATCLPAMRAMGASTQSKELFIRDYESSFGYRMKDLPGETVCFEKLSSRLEKSFDQAQGPGCFKVAKKTIDEDLKMACGNDLWQGLRTKFGVQ